MNLQKRPVRRIQLLLIALLIGVVMGQVGVLVQHGLLRDVEATPLQGPVLDEALQAANPQQLQQALDRAQHGSSILVTQSMTLSTPLKLDKRGVTIRIYADQAVTLTATGSRHLQCSGGNIDLLFENITLDGGGRAGGVVSTAGGLSLAGVRIQNCVTAGSGGGVEATGGALYIEEGTVITGNRAAAYGGGVATGTGAALTIDGGVIENNTATAYGGGVFGGVGSSVRVDGGIISGNEAVLGGGVYAGLANTILLHGGEISGNRAAGGGADGGKGGGVYAVTCDIAIDGARITGNEAAFGGGVYATGDGSDVVVHSGVISANDAVGADAAGGGVYLDTAYSVANTLTVNGGALIVNHGVLGGGVYAGGSQPGPGSSSPGSTVSARVNLNAGEVRANTAGYGGGVYAADGARVQVGAGTVRENIAEDGAGIWISPLQNLSAEQQAQFGENAANSGVSKPAEEDIALHERQIRTQQFTGSYRYGYNNHDVVYSADEVEQQHHLVRFEYQGGAAQESERSIQHGEPVGTLPAPMRTGHTLVGWYTAPEYGELYTSMTPVNESVTLYAVWQPTAYTLYFDYQDGAAPSAAFMQKEVTYGEHVGYLPIALAPEGKAFSGWYDGGGKHYFPASPYRMPGDLTLYARYSDVEINDHVIGFDLDGGTSHEGEAERIVQDGEPIGPLPEAHKPGMVFTGWYDADDRRWDEDDPVHASFTLRARWEDPPYTVTFHWMNAEGEQRREERQVRRGHAVGELPEPEVPNLTWRGWYTDLQWTRQVGADTIVNGDLDLYAFLEGNILFEYGGALDEAQMPDAKPVAYGQMIGALPLPVKTGHFFNGWYTEPEGAGRYIGGGTSGKMFAQTHDLTIYASWEENVYRIVFDYQGGGDADLPAQKEVVFGDNVGALPFPEREGYRFAGWFDQPNGKGEQYFVGTTYLHADAMTLYAHWTDDAPQIPQETQQPAGDAGSRRVAGNGQAGRVDGVDIGEGSVPAYDNPFTGRRRR